MKNSLNRKQQNRENRCFESSVTLCYIFNIQMLENDLDLI